MVSLVIGRRKYEAESVAAASDYDALMAESARLREAVESYRDLLVRVRETLSCKGMAPPHDVDHYCPNCGSSSGRTKDLIAAALSPQETQK